MKVIKENLREGDFYFSTYLLDKSYVDDRNIPGLLIFYTMICNSNLEICEITLDFFEDIHEGNPNETYDKELFIEEFPSFDTFCEKVDINNLAPWTIELEDFTIINRRM